MFAVRDGERAFSVYVVMRFIFLIFHPHSFAQTNERMCVLSVELYDQILELCLYLHTDFPAFFPFILCTNKKQHFFFFFFISI